LLERGEANDETWNALCQELFHQGDVGEASYATVPHLVRIHLLRGVPDWNTYSLASIIEDARQTARNPKLPDFLREGYEAAWRTLIEIGLVELADAREPLLVSNIIAAISMGKRQFQLGKFAMLFDEDERRVLLDDAGW